MISWQWRQSRWMKRFKSLSLLDKSVKCGAYVANFQYAPNPTVEHSVINSSQCTVRTNINCHKSFTVLSTITHTLTKVRFHKKISRHLKNLPQNESIWVWLTSESNDCFWNYCDCAGFDLIQKPSSERNALQARRGERETIFQRTLDLCGLCFRVKNSAAFSTY